MTRSHAPLMPLILDSDTKKLQEWGFLPGVPAAGRESPLRNIFAKGQAPAGERYSGHPADGGTPGNATAEMLERLAVHMKCPWPNLFGAGDTTDENDAIPAGYTYLAQLVAHDLVHNVAPLPRLDDPTSPFARDYRTERLVLDTIYGGGPAAGPLPFALEGDDPGQRWQLRLGHVTAHEDRANGGPVMDDQPPRDIARAKCPHLNDSGRPRTGVPDALIADPRNDDHLILSQMTALFHEFHNFVVNAIREMKGRGGPLDEFARYRAYLEARKVVALVYRRIVADDLLPRLLNCSVYEFYKRAKHPDEFLDSDGGTRVPVEFSHAVYRFGHVMVRSDYALNDRFVPGRLEPAPIGDVLDRSSARHPELMPVAHEWLIDWARFFEGLGKTPNHSRRIRPDVAEGALSGDTYFPNDRGREGGIFYRDFARGADAGVRKVASLIDILRAAGRELPPLLADANYREHAIGGWLKRQDDALIGADRRHKFSPDQQVALSQDPPLMFFILFEAAHDEHGRRLGVLGSTILAEVFFAALRATEDAIERDDKTLAAARALFGPAVPGTMPRLIEFITSKGGLPPVVCGP